MSMQIRGPLTFFVKRYLIIVSHVVQSLFILSFLKFLIAIDSWRDKAMKCLPYVHILLFYLSPGQIKNATVALQVIPLSSPNVIHFSFRIY